MSPAPPPLAMSVDVEEWYTGVWDDPASVAQAESRLALGLEPLLQLLADTGTRATFFTLGYLAERWPEWIRRIAAEGHELGIHGYHHRPLPALGPQGFREALRRTRGVLEDLVGGPIIGHRAPCFSLDRRRTPWAFDILAELGFQWDSSIFPIHNPRYGDPGAPRHPSRMGEILEIPLSTLPLGPLALPVSGGFYLRALPGALSVAAFRHLYRRGELGVLYIHPWELDPAQPSIEPTLEARLRHRIGLGRAEGRLRRILQALPFGTVTAAAQGRGLLPG